LDGRLFSAKSLAMAQGIKAVFGDGSVIMNN